MINAIGIGTTAEEGFDDAKVDLLSLAARRLGSRILVVAMSLVSILSHFLSGVERMGACSMNIWTTNRLGRSPFRGWRVVRVAAHGMPSLCADCYPTRWAAHK